MKKRLLSILMTACLLVGLLPTVAFAEGTFTAIDGTDGADDTEGYASLVDGNKKTKWCVTDFNQFSSANPCYVIFKASKAMKVTGYYITTGNDNESYPGRNPKNWTLYGCNNYDEEMKTGDWTAIDSVTNDEVLKDKNNETYYYEVTGQEESYQYFKLEITATKSADVMQLSEFTLTSCTHNWVKKKTTPATCTTKGYTTYECTICTNTKIADEVTPLGHNFSGENGECIRCEKTKEQLYTFDVSKGRVTIMDDEYSGKLLVRHGNTTYERYIDASQTITVTGSGTTTNNELHVNATTPVTIKAENLNINRSGANDAWAMSLDASKANVTLILEGENSFAGGRDKAGISVGAGKTLTIEGTGSLAATGGSWAAGIGGDQNESCGTITINSGTVTATGGDSAAGIGGGAGGAGGTVTINSGEVTATGGTGGAGIGGGGNGGAGGTVIITGGTVNAKSDYSAGIGSGNGLSDNSTVTISGGTVNAQSTGGASNGSSGGSQILPIASSDGDFDKPDSNDANGGSTGMSCGICAYNVTVKGGSVTATGGAAQYSYGICADSVTVKSGSVTTEGGAASMYSNGIYAYNGVTISDGSVTATGGKAGESSCGIWTYNDLTISGGRLLAKASDGAEDCAALNVNPDLSRYAFYQWRTDAKDSYTVGNFVWDKETPYTYVEIIPGGSSGFPGGNLPGGGSSGLVTYVINVEESVNGSATSSHKTASKGTTVTLTVEPDKGYTLETLTVTDKNGSEIELTDKGDGKFTFKMPASKVTVKATFMEDNSMLNFFVDVFPGDYYYDAVLWAAENGITGGTDAVHFSPNAPCTRAQIVTFLWRAAGCPEPESLSSFSDVPADAYYAKAVAWAVENGITTGTGDGTTFSPDATCTRAQAMAFIYRSEQARGGMQGEWMFLNPFDDVNLESYYGEAVMWAVANGVTDGTTATTFSPNANCTRAQIVTFLYRCLGDE